MKVYIIETTAESPIREFWRVEAATAQEAYDKFEAGDVGEFIFDEVLGEETNRTIAEVYPLIEMAKTIALHKAQQAAPTMLELLQSVEDDWGELFDNDEPMNGGDCCEWLCQFIERAREVRARVATPGG